MFGLGIALREIFLSYSTQFVFLTITFVPGNVVMVAIDICEKKNHHVGVDICNYMISPFFLL